MPETVTIAGDNLTIDLILWRRYGIRGLALIEQAMELNPSLTGPFLPIGAKVTVPDLPAGTVPNREVVTLFG